MNLGDIKTIVFTKQLTYICTLPIHILLANKLQLIYISNFSMILQPEGMEYAYWLMHEAVLRLFSDSRGGCPS